MNRNVRDYIEICSDQEEADRFKSYVAKQFHNEQVPVQLTRHLPVIEWEDQMVARHWLTWVAAQCLYSDN